MSEQPLEPLAVIEARRRIYRAVGPLLGAPLSQRNAEALRAAMIALQPDLSIVNEGTS